MPLKLYFVQERVEIIFCTVHVEVVFCTVRVAVVFDTVRFDVFFCIYALLGCLLYSFALRFFFCTGACCTGVCTVQAV